MKTNTVLNLRNKIFLALLLISFMAYAQEDDQGILSENEIAIAQVDQAPYPNQCKPLKDKPEALKQCFSDYITEFVGKKFKTNKFKDYKPQLYRITVQFTIDQKGKVSKVMARGPHKDMEDEAISVIKKMPKMNPGYFEGEAVNVLYGLPINFIVPEKKKKN